MSAAQMWKVLVDGQSCHGGVMTWSLPQGDKPGEWHEHAGALEACRRGLHVTTDPAFWWKPGCRIYLCEVEGTQPIGDDKHVCRRVRLMREATADELTSLRIFTSGSHEVSAGMAIASGSASVRASGSASVRASGSASVRASGSASVEASGSASVRAWDSASVEAWDSASVEAWDSASVEASGSASVRAWDSASVEASGSASVRAWDSASVEAKDQVTVVSWRGKPGVKLLERAVWIERGDQWGPVVAPKVHVAEGTGGAQ